MKPHPLPLIAALLAGPAFAQAPSGTKPRSVYGARMTAAENEDDPDDRRVIKRLNTRVNNRLATRIERYEFIDADGGSASASLPNPYRARSEATSDVEAPKRADRSPR